MAVELSTITPDSIVTKVIPTGKIRSIPLGVDQNDNPITGLVRSEVSTPGTISYWVVGSAYVSIAGKYTEETDGVFDSNQILHLMNPVQPNVSVFARYTDQESDIVHSVVFSPPVEEQIQASQPTSVILPNLQNTL